MEANSPAGTADVPGNGAGTTRAGLDAVLSQLTPSVPSHATEAAESLWDSVLDSLRPRLSPRRRDEIANGSRCLEQRTSSLRVAARPEALRAWVQDGRLSLLDAALSERTAGGAELAMVPSEDLRDQSSDLERFVASSGNQIVYARALELLRPAADRPSPILFSGPPGSGKTHLLRGIARELLAQGRRVALLSGETLSLALVAALREGRVDALRAPLREADWVIVDELESLGTRELSQRELVALIDSRANLGRTVLLGSRWSPDDAHELTAPLRGRLAAGEHRCVEAPEWEARVAITLDRFASWQVQASPEVASLLATALGAGLSRLDAVLTRIMSHPSCANGVQDQELVRRVLEGGRPLGGTARPHAVIRVVSEHFRVRPNELRSRARSPRVATPRQVAMYLLRHHCGLSFPEIGERFRRHHTTAMHACKKIESQRNQDSGLRASVALLEKELLRLSETTG